MTQCYTQIVEGCRRGDRKSQRALYDAFAPMAMGVCMRFAGSRAEAEDMLQDSFVRVFERIGGLKDPERLGGWVHRVVVNVCLRQASRQSRQPDPAADYDEPWAPPADPFALQEVVDALQHISPRQRAVFNLVEVEGYSLDEAAAAMHSTNANMRVSLSRAKSNLRRILTEKKT